MCFCLLTLRFQLLDLDRHKMTSGVRSVLTKALLRLSKSSGLHPDGLVLSDELQRIRSHPVAAGTFGDV